MLFREISVCTENVRNNNSLWAKRRIYDCQCRRQDIVTIVTTCAVKGIATLLQGGQDPFLLGYDAAPLRSMLPDVSRQRSGLIFKGGNVQRILGISTVEDETTTLPRNVANRLLSDAESQRKERHTQLHRCENLTQLMLTLLLQD
jgi:hypothetical protein